jgi:hypothetical protein
MHYLTTLSTNFRDDPDFNESDQASEFESLRVRQRAIDDLLQGKISPVDLLDLLEYQEIDPVEYMDAATAAIETVINQGTVITGWHCNIL